MSVNFDSKEQLAKLLATENLDIVFDPQAKTASMSPDERSIFLPVLSDKFSENFVYDAFISHEVSHALHTPPNLQDYTKEIPFPVINVIEDIRIERLIKERYPGTKKIFNKFGQFLFNQDFFSLEGKDLKKDLSFLDRINVYSKVGAFSGIVLNRREKEIFDKAMSCQTFQEVIDLCGEIVEEVQEEENQTDTSDLKDIPNEGQQSGPSSENNSGNEKDDGEESENASEQNGDESDEDSSSQETGEGKSDSKSEGLIGGNNTAESLSAETLDKMEENIQKEIVENDNKSSYAETFYIGEAVEIGNNGFYIPWENVLKENGNSMSQDDPASKAKIDDKYNEFLSENKFLINSMVKEFTSKKSADEHKRTKESDSGVLDPRKLKDHKITEDIFMKNQVVPEGKNHGISMFIDFSASMGSRLHSTMKQVLVMVMFARRVNIPFEVYAFTQFGNEFTSDGTGIFDIEETSTISARRNAFAFDRDDKTPILAQLFSNEMKKKDIDAQLYYCFYRSYATSKWLRAGAGVWSDFPMGGTPLDSSLIAAEKILKKFKQKNNIQILNTMILSDGISHPIIDPQIMRNNKNTIFDRVTKKYYSTKDLQADKKGFNMNRFGCTPLLLNSLQERVGTNMIFYFVGDFGLAKLGRDVPENKNKKSEKELTKEIKENGMATTSLFGNDQMFLVQDSKINSDENNELQEEYYDEKQLKNDFKKKNKNKRFSKVFARKLLGIIAKDTCGA